MSKEQIFNYENTWSSPRFFFKQNISDFIGINSMNLNLEEFTQTKTFFRNSGCFKVSGNYHSVRSFAQLLEQKYGEYLSFKADWSYYDSISYQTKS